MKKAKTIGKVVNNRIEFDLNKDTQAVCPHCDSGWVILSVGVENGLITRAGFCLPDDAKVPFYCPYCGKDMVSPKPGKEK